MASTSVVRSLKSYLGDDLRRFPVVDGVLPTVEELRRQLANAYSLAEPITIKYVDEEDEKVTVVSDEDLRAAVDIAAVQGKSIVRLYVVPPAAKAKPKPVAAAATTAPTTSASTEPTLVASTSSPAGASQSVPNVAPDAPSSELVLSLVQSFLGDTSVQLALPSIACALIDQLTANPTADIANVIRLVLDAHPAVKQTPLVQFALRYLDAGRPYLDRLLAPLHSFIAVSQPHDIARIKLSVHQSVARALPKVAHVVQTRLTSAALDRAWAVLREWATDPSRPLPLHHLKEAILGRSRHADMGDAIRRFFGGLFSRHGSHPPPPPLPHHFGPFGPHHGVPHHGPHHGGLHRGGPPGFGMPTGGMGPGPFDGPESVPASTPPSSSLGLHPGVICDSCGATPLRGLRFKCTICGNFDLCESCEKKGDHDAAHPMLKIAPPAHARGGRCAFGSEAEPGRRHGMGGRHHHGGAFGHSHGLHGPHRGPHHGFGGRPFWGREHDRPPAAAAAAPPANSGPSMKFVRDVNLSDRSEVGVGCVLMKRWRLANDGAAAWPVGTKLIFTRGDRQLVDAEETPVAAAMPGEEVEAIVVLSTPTIPGRYQAFFRLADAERNTFGPRVWVDLMVLQQPSMEGQQQAIDSTPAGAVSVAPSAVSQTDAAHSVPSPSSSAAVAAPKESDPSSAADFNSATATVADSSSPMPFSLQLTLLDGMGFRNRELNTFLLESKQGDVVAVANWLLEQSR